MTVREWIKVLQWLPQDYVVKLADWNEDYREPGETDEHFVHEPGKAVVLGASEWDGHWA